MRKVEYYYFLVVFIYKIEYSSCMLPPNKMPLKVTMCLYMTEENLKTLGTFMYKNDQTVLSMK